ncbi:hypothetical protein EIP86_006877 [Pleurotus ostreatoroseus]|nr:hypothetical protein EIP86_006877 [Pleurotus ostreatoroseus]
MSLSPLPPTVPRLSVYLSFDTTSLPSQRRMSQSSTQSFQSDFDVVSEEPSPSKPTFAVPAYHPFSSGPDLRGRYTSMTPPPFPPGLSPLDSPHNFDSLLSRPRKSSVVTSTSIPATPEPPIASTRLTPPSFAEAKSNRHSQFYFTDDLVICDVEGCLFRVHRSLLDEDSVYFRNVFARNASKGQSDDLPVLLWRVSRSSFETLLRYLYFGIHDDNSYSQSDWIDLLAAATDFSLPKIRAYTISKLGLLSLDAVDRIQLATKYDVPEWLMMAYVELCSRDDPLHESEALALGAQLTAKVGEVRERMLRDTILRMHEELVNGVDPSAQCTFPPGLRDNSHVAQTIRDVFRMN